jgi:hypothetical protein
MKKTKPVTLLQKSAYELRLSKESAEVHDIWERIAYAAVYALLAIATELEALRRNKR